MSGSRAGWATVPQPYWDSQPPEQPLAGLHQSSSYRPAQRRTPGSADCAGAQLGETEPLSALDDVRREPPRKQGVRQGHSRLLQLNASAWELCRPSAAHSISLGPCRDSKSPRCRCLLYYLFPLEPYLFIPLEAGFYSIAQAGVQ